MKGMNEPTGVELSPHEKKMKLVIHENAVPLLRGEVTELLLTMQSKASDNASTSANETGKESHIPIPDLTNGDIPSASGATIETENNNNNNPPPSSSSSPSPLTKVIEQLEAHDPRCAHIQLSSSKVVDAELSRLASAITNNEFVTEIDLSNNEISDVGVQNLVAVLAHPKAAPKLSLLKLDGNASISQIGATIINGLKIMRKNVQVEM